MWLTAVVAVAWGYIRSQHAQAIQELTSEVDSIYSIASLAAKHALEDSNAAASCETQAIEIAAVALRDRRLAESLKTTDFFEGSTKAWAAIRKVTLAARDATSAASVVSDGANDIARTVSIDERRTSHLFQQARQAWQSATEAESAVQQACARVAEFETAHQRHNAMRANEVANAVRAFGVVEQVARNVDAASKAARIAAEKVEEVKRCCASAKVAAMKGMMDEARGMVNGAVKAKNEAKKEENNAAAAKAGARNSVRTVAGDK
jgi:hypothetical protein